MGREDKIDMEEMSNILYNKATNQFGCIVYESHDGYRVLNCGFWEFKECRVLSKMQAIKLLNMDESWRNMSSDLLNVIFDSE